MDKPKKMGLCADDIWNVIKFEMESFQELTFEYSEFADYTGLKVNYDKLEVLRLGSLRKSDAKFTTTLPLKWSDGNIKILGVFVNAEYKEMVVNNYNMLLEKAAHRFNVWSTRGLSLLGKIQIVNVLINSLFVYKLQCLPTPDRNFFKKYKQMVSQFLWNGKKPKIAYDKLILSRERGGLELRDLQMVNDSLKIANFKKILVGNKPFWAGHMAEQIPMEYFSQVNMHSKHVYSNMGKSMLADLCYAWSKVNYYEPKNMKEIGQQGLWFNSFISARGKWFFDRNLFQAGVNKVIDLLDLDTGLLMPYEQFIELYPEIKCNFLRYQGIIKAVPKEWKRILLVNEPSVVDEERQNWMKKMLLPKTKASKFVYNTFRDKLPSRIDALAHLWSVELNTDIEPKYLSYCFRKINHITYCTKLRFFQYRMLGKTLTTNVKVSKWNEEVSDRCTFCKEKPETLYHLFIDCPCTKKLWKALTKWLGYFHDIKIILSKELIILCDSRIRNAKLINFVLMVTKYYIYKTRSLGGKIKFIDLMVDINKFKQIELLIAKRNDELYRYARKWNDFDVFY